MHKLRRRKIIFGDFLKRRIVACMRQQKEKE